MSLLFKNLLAANASTLNRYGRLLGSLALLLCALSSWMQPAIAEGSRTLYPSSAPAGSSRANLEWRNDKYGGLVLRRTLLLYKSYLGAEPPMSTGAQEQKNEIYIQESKRDETSSTNFRNAAGFRNTSDLSNSSATTASLGSCNGLCCTR